MKSGDSARAEHQEVSVFTDLCGLFNNYWRSDGHVVIVQLRRSEAILNGKCSGSLELRFSVNAIILLYSWVMGCLWIACNRRQVEVSPALAYSTRL